MKKILRKLEQRAPQAPEEQDVQRAVTSGKLAKIIEQLRGGEAPDISEELELDPPPASVGRSRLGQRRLK